MADEDDVRDIWECLFLDTDEIAELLQLIRRQAHYPVSWLLHAIPAYTGMRRGEVLRLTWIDVDLDHGFVTARSRKQSRSRSETRRTIDLHPELRAELRTWHDAHPHGQCVVFHENTLKPLTGSQANIRFWRPMRGTDWCLNTEKNWFKIGFHSYRHSFASNLAARGIDQRIIDEFMGHTTEAMRKRYRMRTGT